MKVVLSDSSISSVAIITFAFMSIHHRPCRKRKGKKEGHATQVSDEAWKVATDVGSPGTRNRHLRGKTCHPTPNAWASNHFITHTSSLRIQPVNVGSEPPSIHPSIQAEQA